MVNEPTVELNDTDKQSLNPCFNGIWLMRIRKSKKRESRKLS